MRRLSLRYIYQLGHSIHPLTVLGHDVTYGKIFSALYDAHSALTGLFNAENFVGVSLKTSWESGPKLLETIRTMMQETDFTKQIQPWAMYTLTSQATELETTLKGELHFADSYFVTQKGGLETLKIINDATILFPADLSTKVPDAVGDIREAGKCIAFELGTAAGFHLLRALETVLRRYFDVVSNGHKRPKARNIGAYLNLMGQLEIGHPKVLAVLDQIRNLHRNALVHPEDVLSIDEAIDLLGIVRSATGAMLKYIPIQITPVTGLGALAAIAAHSNGASDAPASDAPASDGGQPA